MGKKTDGAKLTLACSEETAKKVFQLRERSKITTNGDTIHTALNLFELFLTTRERTYKMMIQDVNGQLREVTLEDFAKQ